MKTVFFGTPQFAAIILEKLIESGIKPALVISASDKPVGRKQIMTPPPVKLVAEKHDIPIIQPEKLSNLKSEISNLKPDLLLLSAYGKLIPEWLLKLPKYGALNLHPSLLPRWRGASPIQYTILNGDEETGVTLFLLNKKMDEGDIIAKSKIKYQKSKITTPELMQILAELGASFIIETLPKWIAREIKPIPQDNSKATYAPLLKKEDGKLDWHKSAKELERQIRAFRPWPGSFCSFAPDGKLLKLELLEADVEKDDVPSRAQLGKTIKTKDDKIGIQTASGLLMPLVVHLEGKKTMPIKSFLNGYPNFLNAILK